MLQVTKDNFLEVLPIVEQALKHCQFYAFDCEMTGLKHTYNDSISYFADMQERYVQVRSLAEQPHKLMLTRVAMTSHCKGFCSFLQLQPPSPAACTANFVAVQCRCMLCSMQVAASAKDFLLCQFGLSAFCCRGVRYEAQTFNFHLFPS